MKKFFGGLFLGLGILIALSSGLCALIFVTDVGAGALAV